MIWAASAAFCQEFSGLEKLLDESLSPLWRLYGV